MRFVSQHPADWAFRFNPVCNDTFCGIDRDDSGDCKNLNVRTDIIEDKDVYKILAELPGMEQDGIRIKIHDDILTISGKRENGAQDGREAIHSERSFGSFSRSFRLHDLVEKSGVSADYKNGLLEIILPKKEESKPKEIEVKVN
jgi:HSP20 family protein